MYPSHTQMMRNILKQTYRFSYSQLLNFLSFIYTIHKYFIVQPKKKKTEQSDCQDKEATLGSVIYSLYFSAIALSSYIFVATCSQIGKHKSNITGDKKARSCVQPALRNESQSYLTEGKKGHSKVCP